MNMPEKLGQCPVTPECTARKLYRDPEGNVYRLDVKRGEFVSHACSVKGSEKPALMYLGEWYNTVTKRTRWIGPTRLRSSAEKPPTDQRYRKRGSAITEWVLVKVWVTQADWNPVK